MLLAFLIILSGVALAAESTANIINSPPELTVTSMNLNPGTNRDIYPFITDDNGDTITCSYCVDTVCYDTCKIYAPEEPGIHKINITLNDSFDAVIKTLTIFVPGEVTSSSSGSGKVSTPLPEDNPVSPYSNQTESGTENDNSSTDQTTAPRTEEPAANIPDAKGTPETCTPTSTNNSFSIKDILFSIVILGLLGTIFGLVERDHKKTREERHEKVQTLGDIFREEDEK